MARLMNRRRTRRKNADATVTFTSARNPATGRSQLCVYATCQLSGGRAGPIWGHSDESVRCALATLTQQCDCPATFHQAVEHRGKRLRR